MTAKNIFLIIALFLLASCSSPKILISSPQGTISVGVELAETPDEHTQGLMFRENIGPNKGMLFVFDKERSFQFWMKNVKFSIDMIFLDRNYKVVDIKENFKPCTLDPCPVYAPKMPAKYVLEVNSGFAKENNVKINDVLAFEK